MAARQIYRQHLLLMLVANFKSRALKLFGNVGALTVKAREINDIRFSLSCSTFPYRGYSGTHLIVFVFSGREDREDSVEKPDLKLTVSQDRPARTISNNIRIIRQSTPFPHLQKGRRQQTWVTPQDLSDMSMYVHPQNSSIAKINTWNLRSA